MKLKTFNLFTKKMLFIASSLLIFFFVLVVYSKSEAYFYMQHKWTNSSVDYRFISVPSSFEVATNFGKDRWNAVPGSNLTISYSASSGNTINHGWVDGSGGALAITTIGYHHSTGSAQWFKMKYDYIGDWSAFDNYSTATHEWGHVAGIAHSNGNCSTGNSYRPTMCSVQMQGTGKYWFRSLENDDKNALSGKY